MGYLTSHSCIQEIMNQSLTSSLPSWHVHRALSMPTCASTNMAQLFQQRHVRSSASASQVLGRHRCIILAKKVLRYVQVRELDTAQSRIHATLARINIMVDRTAAINGVRAALDTEDYEAAARHVQAFLALEQRFGPIRDELDSKQAQEQRRVRRRLLRTPCCPEQTCHIIYTVLA